MAASAPGPEAIRWLDRLRPSGRSNLDALDGVRALAVIAIFVRHAWGLSGSPSLTLDLPLAGAFSLAPFVTMLSSGVDLFFVLSGFLLARSFIRADMLGRPAPAIGRYYAQRILRIGPPYWVALLLVVLLFVPAFIEPMAVYSRNGAIVFGAHALFLQAAYMPAFGSYGVATPFWTLTVEMLFYLTLPALVVGFHKRRWMAALPISAAVVLLWLMYARWWSGPLADFLRDHALFDGHSDEGTRFFLSHQFPAHLFDFAVGMTIANLAVRRELGWRPTAAFRRCTSGVVPVVALAAGVVWLVYWFHRQGVASLGGDFAFPPNYMTSDTTAALVYYFLEEIPFAIGFGLVIFGLLFGPRLPRLVMGWTPLAFFGVIGYSIYLLHMPLLYHFTRYPQIQEATTTTTVFGTLLLLAGIGTIVVSTLFFLGVERPAMAWSRRAGTRATRSAPPSPPAAAVPVEAPESTSDVERGEPAVAGVAMADRTG